jgi:hypothetical protein
MSTQSRGMPRQSRDGKKPYTRVHAREEDTASPSAAKLTQSERETIKLGVYVVNQSPAVREGRRSKTKAVTEQQVGQERRSSSFSTSSKPRNQKIGE